MTVTPLIRKLWILNSNPDLSGSRNPAFGFDPCHCAFILPSSSICQLNLIHLTSEFQWGYHSWHPHVFVKVMPSSKTKHHSGLTQSNIFCSYKSQCGQCLRREGWCFFSYVIIQVAKLMELWHHYTIGGEKNHMAFFYWPGLEVVHITSTGIEQPVRSHIAQWWSRAGWEMYCLIY